jgi:hypothetical protein
MKLDVKLNFTGTFEKMPIGKTDLRQSFKPGNHVIEAGHWKVVNAPYIRVFDTADDSVNISSLDLLFNEGPHSRTVLERMVVKA